MSGYRQRHRRRGDQHQHPDLASIGGVGADGQFERFSGDDAATSITAPMPSEAQRARKQGDEERRERETRERLAREAAELAELIARRKQKDQE